MQLLTIKIFHSLASTSVMAGSIMNFGNTIRPYNTKEMHMILCYREEHVSRNSGIRVQRLAPSSPPAAGPQRVFPVSIGLMNANEIQERES